MWKIIFAVCCATAVGQIWNQNFLPLRCILPLNAGFGNFALTRYYFDAGSGQCKEFNYNGFGGNVNRFRTMALCERVCLRNGNPSSSTTTTIRPQVPARCSLRVDAGPCRALLPRFYFDTVTGTCRRFFYGGCAGNINNFFTLSHCENACLNNRV